MMKDYYNQSMRALQLAGMSERTCECYTRSVRQLVDFYGQAPDKITDDEKSRFAQPHSLLKSSSEKSYRPDHLF
ncbi:MAG: phage integrase N-terminal SAM-like domain-containing protein [Proteobacteria bacterium]|nr:phage integrase N-terminal SAM-like domain-containing protein [Pseudomonadota bacterium]MBU1389327.1 phage integrase N-terminal SAM-like domain-containing protein [Pseudomonadota bacterium]MBU1544147.1 phage integrase N-terminal SAM-like domain-containing protein [Pseudomonadota bacterium]MBU2482716.1 phage integrase N-terminal SAM-like domain-containing protein [Pseudomonadota bacterium]